MTGALPTTPSEPGTASQVVGLPMYAGNKVGVEALWQQIASRLRDRGLGGIPDLLAWPDDYLAHWREPALLLSQACGFPLTTALRGQVRVVGAFRYDVPGYEGVLCRSQLVVRAQDPAAALADFRGRRVAYNSTDSQSGYNSLRALIAPMTHDGIFFASHLETGGHLKSVLAVQGGLADIASIDCVSLAEFRKHRPDATRGIRVLGESAAYPGLPLITAASTGDATLAALRNVIAQAVRDPDLTSLWQDLFVTGFEPLDEAAYRICSAMQDGALALGYPAL